MARNKHICCVCSKENPVSISKGVYYCIECYILFRKNQNK